jgi:phosphoserine phosphatase
MPKIYITRHGQTIWNTQNMYQGWHDSALTEKGQNQATAIGQFLADKDIKNVYFSPLGRVIQTKDLIIEQFSKQDLIQISDDRLKECHYGDLEGKVEEEVKQNLLAQGIDRSNLEVKLNWQFPNGENYNQVFDRIESFLNEILPKIQTNTMIVAHSGTVRCLWAILNQIHRRDAMEYKPNNGQLICFDTEENLCNILDFNTDFNTKL